MLRCLGMVSIVGKHSRDIRVSACDVGRLYPVIISQQQHVAHVLCNSCIRCCQRSHRQEKMLQYPVRKPGCTSFSRRAHDLWHVPGRVGYASRQRWVMCHPTDPSDDDELGPPGTNTHSGRFSQNVYLRSYTLIRL